MYVCGLCICGSRTRSVCIYVYVFMLCLRESGMCVILACVFEVVCIYAAWMGLSLWHMCALMHVFMHGMCVVCAWKTVGVCIWRVDGCAYVAWLCVPCEVWRVCVHVYLRIL